MNIGVVEGVIRLRDEFTSVLGRASSQLEQAGRKMETSGRRMSEIGGNLTRSVTLPLVAAGGATLKFASDFESSFAGVRKTVDATEAEFAKLSSGMRNMSKEIPILVDELNAIGESAGQLGIQKENILGFTRVVADLGQTTDLSTARAAEGMAQLANITQMPQTQFDRLGSSIVGLGNSFATTESRILDFGLRIAGAGEIAGLTEGEIFGIGTAMASVGVEAEAGGTAVQKVLLSMVQSVAQGGEELEVFASTAGRSASEFATLFRDDAAAAFTAFVEGLGQQGDRAFATLEALSLEDQRLIRSFLSLANAGDLLSRAVADGNRHFEENRALTEEAAKRYETFASQARVLWNQLRDVGITIGTALLPVLKDLIATAQPLVSKFAEAAKEFANLPRGVQAGALALAALVAAAGPVLLVAGQLILAFGSLGTVVPVLATAIGTLVLAITPLSLVLGAVALAAAAVAGKVKEWGNEQAAQTGRTVESMNKVRESFERTAAVMASGGLAAHQEEMKRVGEEYDIASAKLEKLLRFQERLQRIAHLREKQGSGAGLSLAENLELNSVSASENTKLLNQNAEAIANAEAEVGRLKRSQQQLTEQMDDGTAAWRDQMDAALEAVVVTGRSTPPVVELTEAQKALAEAATDAGEAFELQGENISRAMELYASGMSIELVNAMLDAAGDLGVSIDSNLVPPIARAALESKRLADEWARIARVAAEAEAEAWAETVLPFDEAAVDRALAGLNGQLQSSAETTLKPIELKLDIPDKPMKTAAQEWAETTEKMGQQFEANMTSFAKSTFATFLAEGERSWEGLFDAFKRLMISAFVDYVTAWVKAEMQRVAANAKANAVIAGQNAAAAGAGGGGGGSTGSMAGLASSASGASSAAITAGAVVAIFWAFWELASDRMDKKKAENFGTEVYGGGASGVTVGTATRQGLDPTAAGLQAQAMQDQLTMLAYQLGVAGTALGRFSLEFNKMTGQWEAFVNGQMVANVNNLEAAWGAIMRAMLDGLQTAGPAMQKMIGEAMKRGAQPAELQALIDLGTKLDMVGVPDVVGQIRQAFMDWVPDANRALAAGVDVDQVIALLAESLEDALQQINDQIDQYLDPAGAMAQVRAFEQLQKSALAAADEIARTAAAVEDITGAEKARQDILDEIADRPPIPGQSPGGAEGGSDIVPDFQAGVGNPLDDMVDGLGEVGAFAADFTDQLAADWIDSMSNIGAGAAGAGDQIAGAGGQIADAGDQVASTGKDVAGTLGDIGGTAGPAQEALDGLSDGAKQFVADLTVDQERLAAAAVALRDQLTAGLASELLQYVENAEVRKMLMDAEHRLKVMQLRAQFAALVAMNQLLAESERLTKAQLAAFETAIDTVDAAGPGGLKKGGGGKGGQRKSDMERLQDIIDQRAFEFAAAGMTTLGAAIAKLNRERAEEIQLAHGSEELLAQVNSQYDQLIANLQQQAKLGAAEMFRDFLGLKEFGDSPFQGTLNSFEEVKMALEEAGFGSEDLARRLDLLTEGLRDQLDAILQAGRQEILDPFQGGMDQAAGVGDTERQLLDTIANFQGAQDALHQLAGDAAAAGLSTSFLAGDLAKLAAAQKAVIRQLGIDFVGSLAALGAVVPVEVTLQLAQMQWALAKAEAISAAMALAAAGAFSGMSFTLADLLGWINGATFEASDFNVQLAQTNRGLSSATDTLKDLREAAARARKSLRDYLDSLMAGPSSPLGVREQYANAQAQFAKALAAAQRGTLTEEEAAALQEASDNLLDLGGQMFGTAGGGFADLFAMVTSAIEGIAGKDIQQSVTGWDRVVSSIITTGRNTTTAVNDNAINIKTGLIDLRDTLRAELWKVDEASGLYPRLADVGDRIDKGNDLIKRQTDEISSRSSDRDQLLQQILQVQREIRKELSTRSAKVA